MRANIKRSADILLKAILAGIGGLVYLSVDNHVIGSFLFAIGLYTICYYSLNLFTGKVGYILINKLSYISDLCTERIKYTQY